MTMLSFRVDDADAEELQEWVVLLRVDRSELLRDALRRHLQRLGSERDATTWAERPRDLGEQAFDDVSDWGPAEDWSDWTDASG